MKEMAVEFLKRHGIEMTGPPLENVKLVSKVELFEIQNL